MDPNNLPTTDPIELAQLISDAWESADDDEKCDLFTIARGLYWYCSDYHGGQGSNEYSVLSTLDYNPGPLENGASDEDGSDYVYDQLTYGNEGFDAFEDYED